MSRKVYLTVRLDVTLSMEEGVEVSEVMDTVDLTFGTTVEGVDVLDLSVKDYEVTDSK